METIRCIRCGRLIPNVGGIGEDLDVKQDT